MLSRRRNTLLACLLVFFAVGAQAQTVVSWANSVDASDFLLGLSWAGGNAPDSSKIAGFSGENLSAPTLNGNASVAGVQFGSASSSYNLSGSGTLALGASGIDNESTGAGQTISVPAVFSATTASANITNQGTLTLAGSISTSATATALTLTGSGGSGTISGSVTGNISLVKDGSGTWALTGANNYSGNTTIVGGALQTGVSGALPDTDVLIDPSSGSAELDLGNTTQSIRTLWLGGASGQRADLTIGPGSLTVTGNLVTFDGSAGPQAACIDGGTIMLAGNTTFNVGHSTAASDASVTDLEISSAIVTAGTNPTNLIKTGAGVLELQGTGSYNGDTVVNAGRLRLSGTGSLPTNTNVTVNATASNGSAVLDLGSTFQTIGTLTLSGAPGSTNSVDLGPTGTLVLNGDVTVDTSAIPAGAQITNGTLRLVAGIGTRIINVGHATGNSGPDLVIMSSVQDGEGSAGLTKTGVGTLQLGNSANSYSGVTDVQTGTLMDSVNGGLSPNSPIQVGAGATLAVTSNETVNGFSLSGTSTDTGTITIDSGHTLQILTNTGNGGIFYGSITGQGTFGIAQGAVPNGVTLTGANSYSGGTFISSNTTLQLGIGAEGTGGSSGSIASGNIHDDGTLMFFRSNAVSSGGISGSGSVQQVGSGTLTLNGADSYTGGTFITAGTVTDAGPGAFSSSSAVQMNGGTLAVGFNENIGGLGDWNQEISQITTSSVTIANGATLAVNNGGSFSGLISGQGSLMINTGTLTLNTAGSNYSGNTFINQGTLIVGAPGALPNRTPVTFGSSGLLDIAHNQTIGQLNGSSSSSITLEPSATLTIQPATSFGGSFNGTINGSGALAYAGGTAGSTLVLGGASTYSGGTTLTGGTVNLSRSTVSSGSVTSGPLGTGSVNVQSGATLAVDGLASGNLTFGNDLLLASGSNLRGANNGALFLSGNVTVPTTSATVDLAGIVSFDGTLKAAAGTAAVTFGSISGDFGRAVIQIAPDPSITNLTALGSGVIFTSPSSIPSTGFSVQASGGYVGIGSTGSTPPTVASLFAAITNKAAFNGTIGFDTLISNSAPAIFSDSIDLSAFATGTTLGSTTGAVLIGPITPGSAGYYFGSGGGTLVVQSALTGTFPVVVSSTPAIPGNGLTLILRGNNTFTGGLSVSNSAAMLDSATALPAGVNVSLQSNGYVGYTENFTGVNSFADFLGRLASGYSGSSVIGLDSQAYVASGLSTGSPSGTRTVNDVIDLSGLGPITLGTMTGVKFENSILAPNQSGANRTLALLAGSKAQLTVDSSLVGSTVASVVVGSTSSATASGVVKLAGANTYAGGTTLNSGTLVVSKSSRQPTSGVASGGLGTGTLTVASSAQKPTLVADTSQSLVQLQNPILLNSSLNVGQFQFVGTSRLDLMGLITGAGGLNVFGNLSLDGTNSFSGGVNLFSGALSIGNDGALGGGTLTIGTGSNLATIGSTGGAHTINNAIVYTGSLGQVLTVTSDSALTVNGPLMLNSNLLLSVTGQPLYLKGPVQGAGELQLVGGTVVLDPTTASTNSGGIEATAGNLILGNANAISSVLMRANAGYIGTAFVPGNLQTGFLNHFDKTNTTGSIGFDSMNFGSPNLFSDPIDLTGFNPGVSLGSATNAILTNTAVITPQSLTYNFAGGGSLEVDSPLVNQPSIEAIIPRSVNLASSSSAPLTLRLEGTNAYTGGTIVTSAGVIFGATALPGTGLILGSHGAYVGTEDPTFAGTPANFINHFSGSTTNTIIGFDSFSGSYDVTADVNLGSFGETSDPQIFLGTATQATISGNITLPSTQSVYRFAGFKGGQLTVGSVLTGSGLAVQIGDPNNAATFSAPTFAGGALSNVTLTGNNSYNGGTMLYMGQLLIGNNNALGGASGGALTVAGPASATSLLITSTSDPALGASTALDPVTDSSINLPNAILLNHDLDIVGSNSFMLSGAISGSGELHVGNLGTLSLSGNNNFTGGIYLQGGSAVHFLTATAVGSGPLEFGRSGGVATFDTSATIHGLSGDDSTDLINFAAGTTLTVDQTEVNSTSSAEYMGAFSSSGASIIYKSSTVTEPVQLRLSGASNYAGSTTIKSGIEVVAANDAAFGPSSDSRNTITVDGGKLAVDSGVTIANPIALTSGALGGAGTFNLGSGLTIGANTAIEPGLSGTPANLTLIVASALILANNGNYTWRIMDAANATGGWDTLTVNGAVQIASDASNPFTINVTSVGVNGTTGLAANFNPNQSYSWTLLTATSITGLNNLNQLSLNTTSFQNLNLGVFSLAVQGGNSLTLNFSPIPEPSTYALILTGLGLTLFSWRRQRRRS